ncbi:hypothetical protein QE385_003237 [Sphingomonas sp. SORGH_AS 950]|uniref:DUF736 family protein n=1 Tax=Sphingomonas sp. SORGH_AS_0950 TaxID=3041792 RepID=UPI002784B6F4|nr:DUF736 family protein [Sphingomonas sp. SORGH_AS_0950]MDQ1158910.1 hypothetical protein [Sphingomonas sp. SORGH_AS_0950]
MDIGEIIRSENGRVSGYVAEAAFDFDFFFQRVVSDNPDAPGFNLMAKSPRGRDVRIGSIWERTAKGTGEVYFGGYIDTVQSGMVPIRIFRSTQDTNVWVVARHNPRRRQERDAIDLPEPFEPEEAQAPRRQRRQRATTDDQQAA